MPSRRLTPADSALSLPYWQQVQTLFGGPQGHSVDLMALPSNVRPHLDGAPLPFFSPFPVAGATAVNLFAQDPAHHPSSLFRNPYVFSPHYFGWPVIALSDPFSPSLYPCYSRCLSSQILVAPSLFPRSLLSQTCSERRSWCFALPFFARLSTFASLILGPLGLPAIVWCPFSLFLAYFPSPPSHYVIFNLLFLPSSSCYYRIHAE